MAKAVENLISVCNEASPNEELNNQLKNAAAEVSRTLNDLLNHMRLGTEFIFIEQKFTTLFWSFSFS